MTRALSALAMVLVSCGPKAATAPSSVPPAPAGASTASAGVQDPALRAVLEAHWAALLEAQPEFATQVGHASHAHRVDDVSPEAHAAAMARAEAFLSEARTLDADALSSSDRDTLAMLTFELERGLGESVCHLDEWMLSARMNPVGWTNSLQQAFPEPTPDAGAALLARYRAVPARVDQVVSNLQRGLADGRVASAESLRRTLALVEGELGRDVQELEVLAPTRTQPPSWDDDAWAAWVEEVTSVVQKGVLPAWQRFATVLRDELLPAARSGAEIGLHALPEGDACYAARVRTFTTLDRTPQEVHSAGLAAIAAVHAEFRTLGSRAFGTDDLAEIFTRLRTDPSLRFETEAEVQSAAEDALAAARAVMHESFGRLPQAPCTVEPMPAFEAPYSTIAYYRPAMPDGAQPGAYVVNTYAPQTRPRHEARVLAIHEAIPGHHLQIAIAQELPETPAFRKHLGATAFVEGWALYSERLAEEQGLYRDDLDRLGMLAFDAWRSARLVVDTGIHAQGWSREQAVSYMQDNTPLALNNIDNEVDRYISWPGQALAYKTGQLEILALREEAEEALGTAFDVRGFHDTLLGGGAVTLPVLRTRVESWVRKQEPSVGDAR